MKEVRHKSTLAFRVHEFQEEETEVRIVVTFGGRLLLEKSHAELSQVLGMVCILIRMQVCTYANASRHTLINISLFILYLNF